MIFSIDSPPRSRQKTVWFTKKSSTFVAAIVTFTVISVDSIEANSLKCIEGSNVTFACSCVEGFRYCRFKKLFQRGNIVHDGVVGNNRERFTVDGTSANITLRGCRKDDEGTYVSMCGGSDVNKEFHLVVLTTSNESLTCRTGDKVSFRCPCCPEKLDTFTFAKLGGNVIVQKGSINNHHHHHRSKYELSEDRTQVVLKECNEDDEGTYVWTCDTHEHSATLTFSREVTNKVDSMKPNNHATKTSTPVAVLFLFGLILALFVRE